MNKWLRHAIPFWCILLVDSLIVFLAGVMAFWLFRGTGALVDGLWPLTLTMALNMVLSWAGFRLFNTFSGVMRYSSFVDLAHVACGNMVAWALMFAAREGFLLISWSDLAVLSRAELIVAFFIATMLMWSVRIMAKVLFNVTTSSDRVQRVLIYGALEGGVGLAKNISNQLPRKYQLKGFISHENSDRRFYLMGQKVYGMDDDLPAVIRQERIETVLISPLRMEEFRKNQAMQDLLIGAGVKIMMVQDVKELSVKDGHIEEEMQQELELKEVSVEDLLPRSEIRIDMKSVGELLRDKCVMVTGAAGSIGSELVRQIASFLPGRMVLVDQAETAVHDIRLMLRKEFAAIQAETIVTSICHEDSMEGIFRRFRPDYVFHAAAYKHVPMMEDNPSEAVYNNIYGTKVLADLAVKYGVRKFVMISTDKAVNPTNVMGCSKRICEIYVQSLNKVQEVTQFVTTRFGNVLGSSGSVIPLFQEQIRNGGPVTVTDEHIVRYFMLIPEACQLVLEAGTKGKGGEIFAFDMGQPVKIADLAKRMILLSKAKRVEIKYTGLRPGEKLYEEVMNDLERSKPSFNEKIRIAQVREYDFDEVCKEINELIAISRQSDDMAIVAKMKAIVPEYKSNNSIYEVLDR